MNEKSDCYKVICNILFGKFYCGLFLVINLMLLGFHDIQNIYLNYTILYLEYIRTILRILLEPLECSSRDALHL